MQGFESLQSRVNSELGRLKEFGRLRDISKTVLPTIVTADLSHNDYLSLRFNHKLSQLVTSAITNAPIGSGASRLLGCHDEEITEFESKFSHFKKAPSTLLFQSGYTANESVITTLAHRNSSIYSDQFNHASIIDGIRMSVVPKKNIHKYKHLDYEELECQLAKSNSETNFIITESVFSMDGDIANLNKLTELANTYRGVLIVDEAHGVGVFGTNGNGVISAQNIAHENIISVNPFGKAFANQGAAVCGPQWVKDYLVNKARAFIYSTAPSPKIAKSLSVTTDFIARATFARIKLIENAANITCQLRELGFDCLNTKSQIIPVIIGSDHNTVAAAEFLKSHGILCFAIRPPTVQENTARLRLSLNANLEEPQIDHIVATMKTLAESL